MMLMAKAILVVDDEEDVIYIVKTVLMKKGYKVIEAKNGREALEKVKKEKVDAVILDIMMPDINGWEVCRKIKEDEETKDLPVVMLSVLRDFVDRKKSIEYAKADYHLTKPIEFEMLLNLIGKLTRENN